MSKKKKNRKENTTMVVDEIIAIEKEKEETFKNLSTDLEEIRKFDGVTGYILRNDQTALIDLEDPAKLVEYALLSSKALETGKKLPEILHLGPLENILIQAGTVTVICKTVDENKINIFMKKGTDTTKILDVLLS